MPLKRPTWPMTGSAAAWIRCTADWALLLPPDSEDRCYAHFALQAHASAGRRRDVDKLVRKLLPTSAQQARDLVVTVANIRAIADAYLTLGDDVKAREHLESLDRLAAHQRKTSDAQFLRDAVAEFCRENGLVTAKQLAALDPDDRVMSEFSLATLALQRNDRATARRHAREAARVARAADWVGPVFKLLLDLGVKRDALALYRKATKAQREDIEPEAMLAAGLQRQAVAAKKAGVEAALTELVPTEWNLHVVMSDLQRAIEGLRTLGRDDLAKVALDVTVKRMASGLFDSRGFASGGAYVSLAEMVFAQRGWPDAEPWLSRALTVSDRRDRPIMVPAVVDAATRMKQFDRALEWASLASRKAQLSLRAKVLAGAGRWKALRQLLAPLKRSQAAEAAKLAWRLTPESKVD